MLSYYQPCSRFIARRKGEVMQCHTNILSAVFSLSRYELYPLHRTYRPPGERPTFSRLARKILLIPLLPRLYGVHGDMASEGQDEANEVGGVLDGGNSAGERTLFKYVFIPPCVTATDTLVQTFSRRRAPSLLVHSRVVERHALEKRVLLCLEVSILNPLSSRLYITNSAGV